MRRLSASLAALVVGVACVGCGEGDDGQRGAAAAKVPPVGKDIAGSVVGFADCADWRKGSRAEREVTIDRLRGQLTPQRSKSAASPLPDEHAYTLIDKACRPAWASSMRLYKLYVRMQGFAPLSE